LYYRAADVVTLPGRGGIVISEAMAYGLPVAVHQADGTEYDLVIPDKTGFRMQTGSPDEWAGLLRLLERNPERSAALGENGRRLVAGQCSVESMCRNILEAVTFARLQRRRHLPDFGVGRDAPPLTARH
jgi:glycosyltransferase involved in cell wall biosynthesis